ncbi:MAG: hypothetical protein WC683_06040 [bacterium]
MTLRHKDVWTERYRGISIEIVRWTLEGYLDVPDKPAWNYYLYLREQQIPIDLLPAVFCGITEHTWGGKVHRFWDYTNSILNRVFWHGGITLYEVDGGIEGVPRVIRVGCDYMHLHDEELAHCYNEERIANDARRTVDELWDLIPNLKVWCSDDGEYRELKDTEPRKDGYVAKNEALP